MQDNDRRLFLKGVAATGVFAAFGALPGISRSAEAAVTLNILSWGWGYDKTIKDVLAPKFSGADINLEVGTNAANYAKLKAQRANPVINGGTFNGIFSHRGHGDDMWVPLDKALIPNAAKVVDNAWMDTGGVIFGAQPYGIVYNPKYVEAPTSWLDLFDPKYKGKVGLSDFYFDGFAMTAKAMGRSHHDMEAGIREWAKHKDNIGPWPSSPAAAHDLVEKGELWLAFTFGGIAEGARARGKKIGFAIPKEGATSVVDVIHCIKGFDDKTTELTQKFLGTFLDDASQIAFTRNVFTSPVSKTVKIPADMASKYAALMTAEDVAKLYQPDFRRLGKKYGDFKNLVNQLLKG